MNNPDIADAIEYVTNLSESRMLLFDDRVMRELSEEPDQLEVSAAFFKVAFTMMIQEDLDGLVREGLVEASVVYDDGSIGYTAVE